MRSLKAIEALLSECASDLEAHAAEASAKGFQMFPAFCAHASKSVREGARLAVHAKEQQEADAALDARMQQMAAAMDLVGSAISHVSTN